MTCSAWGEIIGFGEIIVYTKPLRCGLVIDLMKMESIAGPLEFILNVCRQGPSVLVRSIDKNIFFLLVSLREMCY